MEVARSQRQYQDLVESLDGIVWEINASDFRFTFVSKQSERLLGYSPERWLTELTWQDLIHPDDLDHVFAICGKAIEEGRNHDLEYRMIAADGRVVWIRDIATLVANSDRPVKVRGVLLDISERKQMEEALQNAREELEGKVERQMLRRNPYMLTFRELTVLDLVGAGRSDKEIGLELGISPLTASKHVSNILAKMSVASRTEASVRAVKEGLLD